MTKILWIFGVAFGIVLYAAGSTGPNAKFSLACGKGVTATLDQVTAYNDAPALATKWGPCGSPTFSCSSNTTSMLCVGKDAATGAGFTVKGYKAGNTTGPAPWGLNVTDSKGNKQTCIAQGLVPSKFSCTTISGKGVSLNVVNSK